MWPKFGNSSISVREVIRTSILLGFDRKSRFFLRGGLGSSSIICTRYKLKILHQCGKRVKAKSQKFWGTSSNACRSYRGKTGRAGLFAPTLVLNRVNAMPSMHIWPLVLCLIKESFQKSQMFYSFSKFFLWLDRQAYF